MKGEFVDFLSWFTNECDSTPGIKGYHAERALGLLMQAHAKAFGEQFDAYPTMGELQKSFRQTDVTDSPELDMAFWHLMHSSRLIWEWETDGYDEFMTIKRRTDRRKAAAGATPDAH